MNKSYELAIEKIKKGDGSVTKITNQTPLNAFLMRKPNPGKRRVEYCLLITPYGYILIDQWDVDFTKYYISFEDPDEN